MMAAMGKELRLGTDRRLALPKSAGEIKRRHSKTEGRARFSNGRANCDALLGDWCKELGTALHKGGGFCVRVGEGGGLLPLLLPRRPVARTMCVSVP